jgi:hypothetical protein
MADGLHLTHYAAAKQLPIEFLRECGVTEGRYIDRVAVRIPYYDEGGTEVAVRWRLALEGDGRFRWRKDDKPVPYGLSRLGAALDKGHIILCEGESDPQTLWHHGHPALGLPGAASWKSEWDTKLTGIDIIYVMVEPDSGGEAVLRWRFASGATCVRCSSSSEPMRCCTGRPERRMTKVGSLPPSATMLRSAGSSSR